MPFYQRRGSIPPQRHIQSRDQQGRLHWEELVSREGFSGIYSNVYHLNPPTAVEKVGLFQATPRESWSSEHRHHHFETGRLDLAGDAVNARVTLFFNRDVIISKAHVEDSMTYLTRNGHHDEAIFIHQGAGVLHSNFGRLELKPGDYLVIPRGVIWQLEVEEAMRQLVIETSGGLETPPRYRNRLGQLLEQAPFSERDIRTPEFVPPVEGEQPVEVLVRLHEGRQTYLYRHHPFDLVGWDGYLFPWIFNINDFQPITGRVHQPPPVHQTFQAPGLVICSFVPRLFDYHPQAVPAPYAHSNVDSDEILYYVTGEFMSRQGISPESITYHPMGLPHGPQPGRIEASLGKKETRELAVMVDTFRPLNLSPALKAIDDENYPYSWLEN